MILLAILIIVIVHPVVETVFRCEEVRRQSLLDFYLVQTCSRSTMKTIARANLTTPERCALYTLQKRGLAFNFSPPGRMNSKDTCIVCDCPEFEALTSLKKDWRYDYYSLYGNPLPSLHHTCIPKVGVFILHRERLNFSQALKSCRSSDSELAHILSEVRTNTLSVLVKQEGVKQGSYRAYVGLDDRKVEGRFTTTLDEPLNCFDYIAWAPSEPRDRLADEDCVVLDGNRQWGVTRCSAKMPYLCELWPGGDQPLEASTRLLKCAASEYPDGVANCIGKIIPEPDINKFHRCWRGIKPKLPKYKKKLPSLLEWNIRLKNETQQSNPSLNETQKILPPQNGTEEVTPLQNVTEQAIPSNNGTDQVTSSQNTTKENLPVV